MNKTEFPHRRFFHTDLACIMFYGKVVYEKKLRDEACANLKDDIDANPWLVPELRKYGRYTPHKTRRLNYKQARLLYHAIIGFDDEE